MKPVRLTPEQVVDILMEKVNTVAEEWADLDKATNRVCAQTLTAPVDVPHFKRSRVDGYAINEQDLFQPAPLTLMKTGVVPAGSVEQYKIEPGVTIKIMTGAPIPLDTGAVIKQEEVEEYDNEIKVNFLPTYNTNIELVGSMHKKGGVIAKQGDRYDPLTIEHIAATGINLVPVYELPSVYIINSGSELELPGSSLEYGKIFNSNQSMFLSLLKLAECKGIAGHGQLADDLDLICAEIKKGLELSDLLIINGGNAEGDFDLIPLALEEIGATILINGIHMKPGPRTVVAGYDNKLIFNVPGNPHAGYILFQVLIKPVLKKMQGQNAPLNQWFNIKLTKNMKSISKTRTFCKGALVAENNSLGAIALPKSDLNYGLAPLILDIAPNQGHEGDIVKAMLVGM